MLHPSTKKLIDRLSQMTLQRKIGWVSGDQGDTVAYDTEGYRVLLVGKPAALVLCDALGNELERAEGDDFSGTEHIDGGTYDSIVEAMRIEASRIARGAEDAIASVLSGLETQATTTPQTVAAPIELEEAPDSPISDIDDNIEDMGDEASAIANEEIEVETQPAETVSTASEPSHIEMRAADLDADDTVLEDTPDVGKAVADLANQVNNVQPGEGSNSDGDGPETSSHVFKGAATFNGPAGIMAGGIEEDTMAVSGDKAEPEKAPLTPAPETDLSMTGTPGAISTPREEAEPDTPPPAYNITSSTSPQPGQVLSLSGLTEGSGASLNEPALPEESAEEAASEDEAPIAPEGPEKDAENAIETEETDPAPKRFNPWV